MKFKHILPALAMLAPLAIQAKPAYPGLMRMSNPDGTSIELRLVGDENFSYATDAEGVNIYERDAKGFWVKAQLNGAELLNVPADVDRYRVSRYGADYNGPMRAAQLPKTATEVDANGQSLFPTLGEEHFLVVLLQYADTKFSMDDPQSVYTGWCNEKGFTYQDMKGSVREYYEKTSNGKFKPIFDVSPVVTLPEVSSYYVDGDKYAKFYEAIKYALDALDDQIDFSQYDIDNDGSIDNIYFIYAGFGAADTPYTDVIWPHKSNLSRFGYIYDGKLMSAYACGNELRGSTYNKTTKYIDGVGTFCHEFGHVLGLPDLYDVTYSAATNATIPGKWTVMCNGTYCDDGKTPPEYTAYEKWCCRWLDLEEIKEGHYEMASLSSEPRGIKLPIPRLGATDLYLSGEYYILESRSREGYDTYLPGDGLLLWHIDFGKTYWTSNTVNVQADHQRCTVVPPTGCNVDNAAWPANGIFGDFIAPGYDSELGAFGRYNNVEFKPTFTNIKYDAENRISSFDYTNTPIVYSEVPEFGEFCKKEGFTETSNPGFVIRWTKCPNAKDYALTVKRFNSSGSSYVVNGISEKLIGDVDEFVVEESLAMMKQRHEVTIRAIGEVTSTECATKECVPYELGEYAVNPSGGVAEMEAENVEVYGFQGMVVAPAGARVFSINGSEVRNENLSAGVYLVRYGNKTYKVVVK